MKKQTQAAIVRNRLERYGFIANKWAIQSGIWRLAAVIADLRAEGMGITTEYGTKKVGRNTHYRLVTDAK